MPLSAPSLNCVASGLIDPLCQGVTNVGSSIVSSSASSVFDSMATWVGNGSAWLLGQVGSILSSSTTVNLNAPWFLARYHAAEAILGVVALPLLIATAIQALIQQRPSLLLRAAFIQLPLAMILAGAAVELATMVLAITDELSNALSATAPGAVQSMMTSIASVILDSGAASGSAAPAFIGLLGAVVVAIAAMTLWVELVIRAAAIYVAVAFLPLVLVAMIWPALGSWSRRLGETLLALILSKLVVVAVLEMAVGALGNETNQGFATIVTGIGLLTLAAFAPFSLLRLLPMFESSAALALEGLRQRSTQAVLHGVPRQLGSAALGFATKTPPLGSALRPSKLSTSPGPSSSIGEQRPEDPMAGSAIANSGPPGPVPIVPGSAGAASSMSDPAKPVSPWSPKLSDRDRQEMVQREPSLVVDRDELGPIIRPRSEAQGGRRGT
jgi:hypothetical protein